MSSQPNIYWLASYPKSGNTWTRAFITSLREESADGIDINALETSAIASGRAWIESALEFDIGELSHDEVDYLRPSAYRWLSRQLDSPGYHKIHDAYTLLPNGEALIPSDATKGALCIIRNPLDVAISLAHHNACTVDEAISYMAKPDYAFCANPKRLHYQLRQWLLTWSDHVLSWADAPGINKMIVRYEDMKHNSVETFSEIATFLELPNDRRSITDALDRCKIEKLQAQEAKTNFNERSEKAESFFRKGVVGDWQNTLADKQIQKIIQDHRCVMQRFGYLDAQGMPSEQISFQG